VHSSQAPMQLSSLLTRLQMLDPLHKAEDEAARLRLLGNNGNGSSVSGCDSAGGECSGRSSRPTAEWTLKKPASSSNASATQQSDQSQPPAIASSSLSGVASGADAPAAAAAELKRILDHDNHEMRDQMKAFMAADPLFQPRYNVSLEEDRELSYQRLKKVCQAGFISVLDFQNNPYRIFAAHELSAITDPAMSTKMTVQFNLFGGTVLKLGTERHHSRLLAGIDTLDDVGCFGLTELGYGNNAVEMETTAEYDAKAGEFVINSPTPLSQKYWITNGALHAKHCVVFAQLRVNGQQCGVHGILARIRDDDLQRDAGHTATLTSRGNFTTSIKSNRARFLTVADQLLSGRICIGQHKRALVPLLADTVALNIGLDQVKDAFATAKTEAEHANLVTMCCAIKPLCGWHMERVASITRERCGGQGYLACNRFGTYINAHAPPSPPRATTRC
uniref:Acyl-CoA_dh_M domain-containing protein n=1 Tax=Macrostomum lignano TaxID=282301 RepID=A0A1I8FI66_9PLAT